MSWKKDVAGFLDEASLDYKMTRLKDDEKNFTILVISSSNI